MKTIKIFLFSIIFICTTVLFQTGESFAAEKVIRILFIGNSYTTPVVDALKAIDVTSEEVDFLIESITPVGYRLHQHLANPKTRAKVYNQPWDYVVLQEQSQIPSLAGEHLDKFFETSRDFCNVIKDAGAQPVFFMTWGRRSGDERNRHLNPDFLTMQKRLSDSYVKAARQNGASFAPVGDVFRLIKQQEEPFFMSLYGGDGSHPSDKGAFVAAYSFIKVLTGLGPDDIKVKGPLSNKEFRILKDII